MVQSRASPHEKLQSWGARLQEKSQELNAQVDGTAAADRIETPAISGSFWGTFFGDFDIGLWDYNAYLDFEVSEDVILKINGCPKNQWLSH